MDNYNFWQDLFDTYQSLSDWIKALWLVVPPLFVLGLVALTMRFRIESRKVERSFDGELVYSLHRDAGNGVHILRHSPGAEESPALLLLDPAGADKAQDRSR